MMIEYIDDIYSEVKVNYKVMYGVVIAKYNDHFESILLKSN